MKEILEQSDNHIFYSYDGWEEKYKPIENADGDILFQPNKTEDMKYVKEYIQKHGPSHLWTLCHEDDEFYIDAGKRFSNMLHYIITEVPREDDGVLIQAKY